GTGRRVGRPGDGPGAAASRIIGSTEHRWWHATNWDRNGRRHRCPLQYGRVRERILARSTHRSTESCRTLEIRVKRSPVILAGRVGFPPPVDLSFDANACARAMHESRMK